MGTLGRAGDSSSWLQMTITEKNIIHSLEQLSSSIQGYALSVMELIGDTVIFNQPERNDPPSFRLEPQFLGLVTEINQPKTKLQRNRNDQPSEMPKLRLRC